MSDKTLAELADEIWQWQRETFGDRATVRGALAKLEDECSEAIDAWVEYEDERWSGGVDNTIHVWLDEVREPVSEELADCFFVLVHQMGLSRLPAWRIASLFAEHQDTQHEGPIGSQSAAWFLGQCFAFATRGHYQDAIDAWWRACCCLFAAPHFMPIAIAAKLAKNKAPTEPADDGTFSHVKGVE